MQNTALKKITWIFVFTLFVVSESQLFSGNVLALTISTTNLSTTKVMAAKDVDSDGYSSDGTIGGSKDCNDTDFMISSVGIEVDDDVDNDCDGLVDDGISPPLDILDKATTAEPYSAQAQYGDFNTDKISDALTFTPDHLTIVLHMENDAYCSSDHEIIPSIKIRLNTPDANNGDGKYWFYLSDLITKKQMGPFCDKAISIPLTQFYSEQSVAFGDPFNPKTQNIGNVIIYVNTNEFQSYASVASDEFKFSVTSLKFTGGLSRPKVLLLSADTVMSANLSAAQLALPEATIVQGNLATWLSQKPATAYAAATSTSAEVDYDYIVMDFHGTPKILAPLALEKLITKFVYFDTEAVRNAQLPYYPLNAFTLRSWMEGGGNLVILGPETEAGKSFLSVVSGYFSGQFGVTIGSDTTGATWSDHTICSNDSGTGIDAAALNLCTNLQKKSFTGKTISPKYPFGWNSIIASSAGTVTGGVRFGARTGWTIVSALSSTDLSFLSAVEMDRLDGYSEPNPSFTESDDTSGTSSSLGITSSLYYPIKVFARAGQFNGKPILTVSSRKALSEKQTSSAKTLTLAKLSLPKTDSSLVLARLSFYSDSSVRTDNTSALQVSINGTTVVSKVIDKVDDGRVVVFPVALDDVENGSYTFSFTNTGTRTLYIDAMQLENYHKGETLLFGVNDAAYDEWSKIPNPSTPYDVANEYLNLVRYSINVNWMLSNLNQNPLDFSSFFTSPVSTYTGLNQMLSSVYAVNPETQTLIDFEEFPQWNAITRQFVSQTYGGVPPTNWLRDEFVPAFFDNLPTTPNESDPVSHDVCVVQFGGEMTEYEERLRGSMLDYANHLHAGFDAIQTINTNRSSSDCQIQVMGTAFQYPFAGDAFSATGAWDHMNAASVHLYYGNSKSFGQQIFQMQHAMHKYGKVRPVWAGEFGLDYSSDEDAGNKRNIAEAIDAGLDRIWNFPFFASNTQQWGLFASEDYAAFPALETVLFWFDLGRDGAERIYPAAMPNDTTSATFTAASLDDSGNVRFRGYSDDLTNVHVTLPIDAGHYRITINDGDTSCVEIVDDFYEFDVAPDSNDIKADFTKTDSCSKVRSVNQFNPSI